jgi:hypothetical protein
MSSTQAGRCGGSRLSLRRLISNGHPRLLRAHDAEVTPFGELDREAGNGLSSVCNRSPLQRVSLVIVLSCFAHGLRSFGGAPCRPSLIQELICRNKTPTVGMGYASERAA